MSEISTSDWSETDASNTQSPPAGWPENQAFSSVNNSARAMMGAVKRFWGRVNPLYASSGTAGGYTLAHSVALTTYSGFEIHAFRAHTASVASPTIAIDSLAAIAMKKYTTSGKVDLAANDIISGQPVMGYHDGTHFVVMSPLAPAGDLAIAVSASAFTMATGKVLGRTAPGQGAVQELDIATQAQQETATSTASVVTSGRQHFHPGMAKAWALVQGGTALHSSYNCSGLVVNGNGDATVAFSNNLSTASYAAIATAFETANALICNIHEKTTTGVRVITRNLSGTQTTASFHVVVFGDL